MVGVGVIVDVGAGPTSGTAVGAIVATEARVGTGVRMGVGSGLEVLTIWRTWGVGEATWPTSLSCPQANEDATDMKQATKPKARAKNRICLFIIVSPGRFNRSVLSPVQGFGYLQLRETGSAMLFEQIVELIDSHAIRPLERQAPSFSGNLGLANPWGCHPWL